MEKTSSKKIALEKYRNSEKGKMARKRHFDKPGVKEHWENYYKQKYQKSKDAIFALLGSQCIRCGFNDRRALQIDHIKGGGNKEVKNLKENKYNFMCRKILNGSKDYQVLCANCNWIKRSENNETRKI